MSHQGILEVGWWRIESGLETSAIAEIFGFRDVRTGEVVERNGDEQRITTRLKRTIARSG